MAPRRENRKLIIRVINFELVQRIYPRYVNVTDGQTDGRPTTAIPRFAPRVSRGKNKTAVNRKTKKRLTAEVFLLLKSDHKHLPEIILYLCSALQQYHAIVRGDGVQNKNSVHIRSIKTTCSLLANYAARPVYFRP